MMKRIILAGVVGGIVMFIWTSVAHMFTPLGEMGIREMHNESAVLDALKTNLGEDRGLYVYPGMGLGPDATSDQKREAMKKMGDKLSQNPSGILMYNPLRPLNMPKMLGREFGKELLLALLAVFLLAQTRIVSFVGRVGFVTVVGLIAASSTNVSYWIWYAFPKRYTAAYMLIDIIAFLLVGVVAALIFPKRDTSEIS
jgi:hypothetical protein